MFMSDSWQGFFMFSWEKRFKPGPQWGHSWALFRQPVFVGHQHE